MCIRDRRRCHRAAARWKRVDPAGAFREISPMAENPWTEVDRYITDLLVRPDAALQAALDESAAAGLPAISVAPNQGKLLHLIARIQGARSILEIGTLGGYSTIWLARALPPDVYKRQTPWCNSRRACGGCRFPSGRR